ncbi:uncharacterized protein LOC114938217 [Nylanderia fulva]|uniref:uncharacterized protein LOC114938217 n=1 Tax=Nylanderia fulva TaxID=613905 RepID=UPI0010FB94CC|nr:uncharacterized protein LOC114938217 [Nylanderia fulva]
MNIYVSTINEEWYNNQCEHFIKLFNDFLSNCCTKENTMATSSINQTPKVIINVTEEDTTLKEISAQVEEQSKNRRSVGKYKEKVTPSDDVIEDLNSHKEDEEKEHQEQRDNDKNNEEIIDNFTKCSNSGQKIDGRECQQLKSAKSELYKWFQQFKESGNITHFDHFKTKGLKLMEEYDVLKTYNDRYNWLHCCFKSFEEQEFRLQIQELTHRLKKKDIKRDNVYIMFKTQFYWKSLIPKSDKKIDMQKLTGYLNVIFCTNITDDHKLPPFYFYNSTMQTTAKDIKNIPNLCTTSGEIQKIVKDWYNNHFVRLVKKRQQETNVSDKVLLIVSGSKTHLDIHTKDITQNDNFEIQFIPGGITLIYKIIQIITKEIRNKCKEVFHEFCTSYDINIYVSTINEEWYNNQCEHFIKLFNDFLSNCCTKENTMATSSINQTPKVIINVTEEDTTLKEISAQVEEQSKNRRSVGKYKEKVTPLDDVIEDLNSHKEDEEKEHQEQQDNDKNNEITDNFTKCSNSGQKIDGRECQQLESTGSADNIISVEDNVESSQHENILAFDDNMINSASISATEYVQMFVKRLTEMIRNILFSVKQEFETCHKQDSDHTKNEMAAAYVYRNTISNIERTQSPVNQAIGQPAENVIQELTHRLEKKNVKRDNVYIMFKTKFQWSKTFIPKSEKKIDRQILTDFLNVIFCTNITDWCNNHFVKLVKKRQQETNVSDKVLLIVLGSRMFPDIDAKYITQNDNFEIISQNVQTLAKKSMEENVNNWKAQDLQITL